MPFSTYLPEHMGSIRLTPSGPFVAAGRVTQSDGHQARSSPIYLIA